GFDHDRAAPRWDVDAGVELVLTLHAGDARRLAEAQRRGLRAGAVGERKSAEVILADGALRYGKRDPDAALLAGEQRAGAEDGRVAGRFERIAGGLDDAHAGGGLDTHREAGGYGRARRVEFAGEDGGEILGVAQVVVVSRAGVGEGGHQVLVE